MLTLTKPTDKFVNNVQSACNADEQHYSLSKDKIYHLLFPEGQPEELDADPLTCVHFDIAISMTFVLGYS